MLVLNALSAAVFPQIFACPLAVDAAFAITISADLELLLGFWSVAKLAVAVMLYVFVAILVNGVWKYKQHLPHLLKYLYSFQ